MSIALLLPNRQTDDLVEAILKRDPTISIQIYPDIEDPDSVEFAVVWYHPDNELNKFKNLKAISSYGAGVDHILNDPGLPEEIPFARIVAKSLIEQMNEYVLTSILNHKRSFPQFFNQQSQQNWLPVLAKTGNHVGIMGLGQLGKALAHYLRNLGFKVSGWSQSKKEIEDIETYQSDQLDAFLKDINYLVCLLPLTQETDSILNQQLFSQCKRSPYLINVARGRHVVDADLIHAIETDQISGACLDVFRQEPLPKKHPFWQIREITITPHIAAVTSDVEAAEQIVKNYHLSLRGKPLINQIDRNKGY